MEPKELYDKLLSYYGPQHWWPGEGFEIAIGAILTQNTSWTNVEKALANLRKHKLLSPRRILDCDLAFLKKQLTPAGYYNQKAVYLRNLSQLWLIHSNPTREQLLSVKGIGAETADSILLYLLAQPEFVIDAYTVRISNRLGFGNSTKKNYWKRFYEQKLEADVHLYNEFHALFVIHAKIFCKKQDPLCQTCFLQEKCACGKKK
ncbi:MAG: endonuclease [Candidatus Heimdallarchaeota archaeon]|nr:endonuclease [Candidatus Heimdallarchaeota archaeon]